MASKNPTYAIAASAICLVMDRTLMPPFTYTRDLAPHSRKDDIIGRRALTPAPRMSVDSEQTPQCFVAIAEYPKGTGTQISRHGVDTMQAFFLDAGMGSTQQRDDTAWRL